jgi:hypothetical protein
MKLEAKGFSPHGNYYEFGLGWGETLTKYIGALRAFCRDLKRDIRDYKIFGFDSFEGLPGSEDPRDERIHWKRGAFSHSQDEVLSAIRRAGINPDNGSVRLVKGFFEKSLNVPLREELSKYPPSIITMDADLYSSTKTVLEWLRPILGSGTMFYFDNIWSFHGNPKYGEIAAINEFNSSGDGYLAPFPEFGIQSCSYIYSRKDFEYR